MKSLNQTQIAQLSLLKVRLGSTVPSGMHGYLDLLTKSEQPQPVAAEWLARLETVSPGVTAEFWSIVNS